jgi:hypothetical protein
VVSAGGAGGITTALYSREKSGAATCCPTPLLVQLTSARMASHGLQRSVHIMYAATAQLHLTSSSAENIATSAPQPGVSMHDGNACCAPGPLGAAASFQHFGYTHPQVACAAFNSLQPQLTLAQMNSMGAVKHPTG